MRAPPAETDPERLRSTAWLRFFEVVLGMRLRRSFHAVRVARPGLPAIADDLPLIVYCNHPSWWDGALVPVLTRRLFPERRAYGPIDAEALRRYPFMRRLGLFGVDLGSYAGAATFLRVGRAVLARPDTLFCLMPEGRFRDARPRPLHLRSGLAGLISAVPRATVLPLAVEYPFWDERLPEALVRFGEPQIMGAEASTSIAATRDSLERRLTDAMDRLAADAISRDPDRFVTVLDGRAGVGGVYGAWRRLTAWRHGERFDAAHRHAPEKG